MYRTKYTLSNNNKKETLYITQYYFHKGSRERYKSLKLLPSIQLDSSTKNSYFPISYSLLFEAMGLK